jgi:hypothetical protein
VTEEERNQPATKGDVRDAIAEAVAPLATKDELAGLATKAELNALRAEMELGFARLMEAILAVQRSIAPAVDAAVQRVLNISDEEWARRFAVLDEKYKDLPPRVTTVEVDLAEHKQDFRLHKRPRPS